jgi:ribosomal protein S18 acetylase RimI-like enzyme
MTGGPAPRADLVSVPLGRELIPPLREILERRPLQNLYFLSVLEHHRHRSDALASRAVAVLRGDVVVGAADCGRNLVLDLADDEDPEALWELARAAKGLEQGRHAVVGARNLVAPFVDAYRELGARLVVQREQVLLRCEEGDLHPAATTGVRRARSRELRAVIEAHSAMCLDDLGHDQVADNPDGYRLYFRELIRGGRVWVIWEGGRIAFKAESAIETSHGAQVEGVYTAAPMRRRGYAMRGMSRVSIDLLRRSPAVTLYVNAHNRPGLRLYEKLGFRPLTDWCTAVLHAD